MVPARNGSLLRAPDERFEIPLSVLESEYDDPI